jgi:hypothetical protein
MFGGHTMRRYLFCLSVLSCLGSGRDSSASEPLPTGDVRQQVTAELARYYEDGKSLPLQKYFNGLKSKQAEVQHQSATRLVMLLDQAQKDEQSGKSPWRATPFWGSSGENPARELRKDIAKALQRGHLVPAALPIYRWYLDHAEIPATQVDTAEALVKIKGPEADKLITQVVHKPHPNTRVVVLCLTAAGERRLALPDKLITQRAWDHHRDVRQAARQLAATRGLKIEPFDPVRAVQSEAVRRLMDRLSKMILDSPPATADYVKIQAVYRDKDEQWQSTTSGWLIKETDSAYRVLTPHGRLEQIDKAFTPRAARPSQTRELELKKVPFDQVISEIVKLRKGGDPDFALSERGGLTGQFQGHGASLAEILVGHWLYAKKDYQNAAKILLPALDTLYQDDHLISIAEDRLGLIYGYRMLAAFAGDRDYEQTLKLASIILDAYPKSRFVGYAEALRQQLPKRKNDFTELVLPTPDEWARLQASLPRDQQIRYLCERMRLLNCFQSGQPGGVHIRGTQYRETIGISRNAAWSLGKGETRLINPYVELTGDAPWEEKESPAKHERMELTVSDIPTITPYVKDDWFILAVSFWRDFHPNRTLLRTRPLFCGIINGLAKRDLCNDGKIGQMTDEQFDLFLKAVNDWVQKNKNKSAADLLLDALREELVESQELRWFEVRGTVGELVDLKEARAAPLVMKYLDAPSVSSYEIQEILPALRSLDLTVAKKAAARYVNHSDPGVMVEIGAIYLKSGDIEAGRRILAKALKTGTYSTLGASDAVNAVRFLLEEGSPESATAAAGITDNILLGNMSSYERNQIVRLLVEHRISKGYEFYLRMLKNMTNRIGETSYGEGTIVADVFANEVIDDLIPEQELKKLNISRESAPARKIAAVRGWLLEKSESLDAHSPNAKNSP